MMLFQSAMQIGELDSALCILTGVIEGRIAPGGTFAVPLVREASAEDPRYDALLQRVGLNRASIEELFLG